MTLKTLLRRPAVTVEEAMPLREACALMLRHSIPCLPVMRQKRLVGMVTELHLRAASPSSVPALRRYDWGDAMVSLTVGDVMTRDPIPLTPDASVVEAARLTRRMRVDAVPVVDGGDVVGVVTRRDLLAVLAGLLEHRQPTGLGHVLAATSLRPDGKGTLGHALRLAAATGAVLTAVHVLARISPGHRLDGATAARVSWMERTRRQSTRQALAALCRAHDAREVTYEVTDGPVAQAIARRAAALDSDLIVVGTPSRRGRLSFASPNVADQLTSLAPCPVLVVPRVSEEA